MTLLAIFEALVGANAIWETTVICHTNFKDYPNPFIQKWLAFEDSKTISKIGVFVKNVPF